MPEKGQHKYLFKEGCKSAFQRRINCNEFPLKEINYGLFESTDKPEFRTYLILTGVDDLSRERRQVFELALSLVQAKQVF